MLRLLLFLQLCTSWQEAVKIGELPARINEASGLAISKAYPGRMYHVNDSGDSGTFFVTDMSGGKMQQIRVAGFHPTDVEDMRVAPCGEGRSCIFLADIGDNDRDRHTIELALIEEAATFRQSVRPWKTVRMRYPDGPHDAESMAIHPDGTILIL